MSRARDEAMMARALERAAEAAAKGEAPIGAVLALDDDVLAEAHNAPIASRDPTAPRHRGRSRPRARCRP